ncbi:MAG TPA: sigma-70 family RNA polymerase sigma factor [Gemmataceae bacterium]|nr:sigma-70 family RNA polymerase sigma factor [Gemmataceae bacterium]
MVERKPADERHPEARGTAAQVTPLSLLERVRANDPAAWFRLVALYQPMVRHWCARGGAATDAEDVTQEVFTAAATALPTFRRDRPTDTFRGWLRGITRNQLLMHFRRIQGRPQAEGGSDAWRRLQDIADPLADADPDEPAQLRDLYQRALEQVRAEFQENTWQAFWRTVIDGHSPSTLSEELGMTPAAIRQAKSRVLRRLRQEMGELIA